MEERFLLRVTACNKEDVSKEGDYVLYWMSAFRRPYRNLALERAVFWAQELKKPLVVLEALRCDYRWACDRFHRFIIEGMRYNATAFEKRAFYFPFVEREKGEGKGLLEALSGRAAVIVADEYPCFFLPSMLNAASKRASVLMEKVDSNGLFPLRAASKAFPSAYSFRRLLQKELPQYLRRLPLRDPLDLLSRPPSTPPDEILSKWRPAELESLERGAEFISNIPLDNTVGPVAQKGGAGEAERTLRIFLEEKLPLYSENRNNPVHDVTSGLSPYLHFGHISSAEIFQLVAEAEEWYFDRIGARASGKRSGWWGMSEPAEAFLDQLITWRELGFNMCFHEPHYDRYDSLPQWARDTLRDHERDERDYIYDLETLEAAETHDQLWNAAQKQLLNEGRIHNYLRMLWGKKILEWSANSREALKRMIELNNKYGLDGRDPNSYSGIFWILGRYDRPWGPERPVFGKVRYMSSANTARKIPVGPYIARYARG
jgi:deoxyribodipyrimidine photo-lyase